MACCSFLLSFLYTVLSSAVRAWPRRKLHDEGNEWSRVSSFFLTQSMAQRGLSICCCRQSQEFCGIFVSGGKPKETGGAGVSEGRQSCSRRIHEVYEEQRTPRTEDTKNRKYREAAARNTPITNDLQTGPGDPGIVLIPGPGWGIKPPFSTL